MSIGNRFSEWVKGQCGFVVVERIDIPALALDVSGETAASELRKLKPEIVGRDIMTRTALINLLDSPLPIQFAYETAEDIWPGIITALEADY